MVWNVENRNDTATFKVPLHHSRFVRAGVVPEDSDLVVRSLTDDIVDERADVLFLLELFADGVEDVAVESVHRGDNTSSFWPLRRELWHGRPSACLRPGCLNMVRKFEMHLVNLQDAVAGFV